MKNIKRLSALLCIVIMLVCGTSANAALPVLDDYAYLFDYNQREIINEQLKDLSQATDWSIVIYTSNDGIDADDMDYYYNEVYDDCDFGDDGVMFVIDAMSENRIIITKGEAMYYFSDERMDEIKSELKPYLIDEDFYGAAETFIDVTEQFYDDGEPEGGSFSNIFYAENREEGFLGFVKRYLWLFIIAPLAGGAIAVVVVWFRYKNNGKSGTYDLYQNSSVKLTDRQDIFLTKHISTSKISSDSGSSGGHSSSSSSTHGSSGSF